LGLEATYAVYLRLIGKPVVDFLFVIIFEGMGHLIPQFYVEEDVPTNHL